VQFLISSRKISINRRKGIVVSAKKKTWDLITSIHQIVPKDEDVAGIITNKGKSAIFYPSNMRDLAVKDWNLSCK